MMKPFKIQHVCNVTKMKSGLTRTSNGIQKNQKSPPVPRSVLFCQVKIQTSWEVTDYAPFQCTNHSWNVYKWTHYKAQLWFFYQIAYTASSGLDGFGLACWAFFLCFLGFLSSRENQYLWGFARLKISGSNFILYW